MMLELLRRLKETGTELSLKPVSLGVAVQLNNPKAGGFVQMLIRDGDTPDFNPGLDKIESELAKQQVIQPKPAEAVGHEPPLGKRVREAGRGKKKSRRAVRKT